MIPLNECRTCGAPAAWRRCERCGARAYCAECLAHHARWPCEPGDPPAWFGFYPILLAAGIMAAVLWGLWSEVIQEPPAWMIERRLAWLGVTGGTTRGDTRGAVNGWG